MSFISENVNMYMDYASHLRPHNDIIYDICLSYTTGRVTIDRVLTVYFKNNHRPYSKELLIYLICIPNISIKDREIFINVISDDKSTIYILDTFNKSFIKKHNTILSLIYKSLIRKHYLNQQWIYKIERKIKKRA